MAFNSADWTINYGAKTITNDDAASGTNLPVAIGTNLYVGPILEWFQWLATTFAATSQMDDEYPVQSDTPTVYRFLNGWTFGNANDYKYLSGGSIVDPLGSGTATADSIWANLYSIGTQTTGTQLYMIQNDTEVSAWWITGNIDILILVKNAGSWIQSADTSGTLTNGGVWIYAREFGDTFDHNFADISGGGRTPIGTNTSADGSNQSGELYLTVADETGFVAGTFVKGTTSGAIGKVAKLNAASNFIYLNAVRGGPYVVAETLTEYSDREAQTATGESTTNDGSTAFTNVVAGYSDITFTFGAISRDLNNGNGSVGYDVEIDGNGRGMSDFYEWLKYITRYGSTGATYTVNGDDGQEYRSADEGTYAEVKVAPFGTLAGTTFYGARGVWLTNYDAADFVLIDDTSTSQSPPNYQKVIATHDSLSGCNIFVTEITAPGGTVIKNQYTISSADSTSIISTTAIDANKTPQTGSIRISDVVYTYTGFSGSTITGVSPDPSAETGDFYIPLMDLLADTTSESSDNIIYLAAFDIRTSVRKYGFKPYDVDTTFTAAGKSFSPILSDDPQAS